MEREPIRFAWRSARRTHLAAAGLALGLGAPVVLFTLLCLRDLVGVLTRRGDGVMPFLAIAFPIPSGADSDVATVFAGWLLHAETATLAGLLGLAAAAVFFAGLGWLIGRLCFLAQARAAGRLRRITTDAILRSPAGTREDLRALPRLMGQVLPGMGAVMASVILVPAMTLAALVLALLVGELAVPRLVPAVALGLLASGMSTLLIMRRARARQAVRVRESEAASAGLVDLIQRMPAVRSHGAATFERRRLGLRALAARGAFARAEASLAYARAPMLALLVLLPAILIGTALWRAEGAPTEAERILPGALVAVAGAFALAASLVTACLRLWSLHDALVPEFAALSEIVNGLADAGGPVPQQRAVFPASGPLVASGAGAFDPTSGERMNGVDLSVAMPSHVAIVGAPGGGSRALAALLAGQIEPTSGSVTYGEVPLRALDPTERAHRIAFAGSEAILIEGTLKQNLLYGARSDDREALDVAGRIAILKLAGLDTLAYARGLAGRIDPQSDPSVAAAVVAARRAVRAALEHAGLARLVEPFDPERYNHQATVGENVLFGEAKKPAFSQAKLASHPYLRAVLEAEDLTQAFVETGLRIAGSTVEIFADLPDDHPLFETYSLFPARERGFFEDLIARQPEAKGWRRGLAGQRDRERLIGLTLRYNETRHRFGLVDPVFEARVVDARRSFAALLPPKFREKVEFYDPDRLTAAASLEENLLFGRVAQGEAGAEARVRTIMRRVLAEQGLETVVYRLGLASRVDPGGASGAAPGRGNLGEASIGRRQRIAIDLVRCLARRPDILVVGLPPDARRVEDRQEQIARLRAARKGKGLILCVADPADLDRQAPFDTVIAVERNAIVQAAPTDRMTLEPVV